jgi:pimeloyl-ACP methyl ester carboxylesterase
MSVVRHLVQFPLIGLTRLVARRAKVKPLPPEGHRPVVFVHGLDGGRGNFLPMMAYFRLNGRKRTYAIQLAPSTPVAELAARLGEFLAEVAEANRLVDGDAIDLVGHSLGGVVARVALDDPMVAARVATLVTLATPHGGTRAAKLARRAPGVELRPDSKVIARLSQQLPWPGPPMRPRLVAFWSSADLLMIPAETACCDGADNRSVDGFTHYDYLLRPESWRRVLDALRHDRATAV